MVMLVEVTPGVELAALALLASNPVVRPANASAAALIYVSGRRSPVNIYSPYVKCLMYNLRPNVLRLGQQPGVGVEKVVGPGF